MAESSPPQHSSAPTELTRSPLHEAHVALGARMAGFGGWQMPLQYAGGGVLEEHTAVRTAVGVFDVSHLGKVAVRGPRARAYVDTCLSGDLARIGPGQAQYTLACDEATGGVVDDLIAYVHDDDAVFLVPNAANAAEVARRLAAGAPDGVQVFDEHRDHAVLAVQGPRSDEVLVAAGLPAGHDYMSFRAASFAGQPVTVCRTGYTGERGYELVAPVGVAPALWEAVLAAGAPAGIRPCGLAARDTLRTEMGYPLHGQDISLEITPVQARLSWAVGWDKPAFWGRDVLIAERAAGPERTLRGLVATGRGIARPGMRVLRDGASVGTVTSGTFSPTLRTSVALALVPPEASLGDEVLIDVRGRPGTFTVSKPPFVPARVRSD